MLDTQRGQQLGRPRRPAPGWRRGLRLCWALAAASGCEGDILPPTVQASDTVEAPSEPDTANAPLSVVHAAPRGMAGAAAQVVVLLSKPMRKLEPVSSRGGSGNGAPAFVRLEPPAAGEFRWLGTRAVVFAPETGRLPAASAFEGVVAAGARALDGDRLAEEYRFEFETPRPRVLQFEPADQQPQVGPDTPLVVRFNQPVSPAELQAKAQVRRLGDPRPLGFVAQSHATQGNTVVLRPSAPWPLAATLELSLPAGLRGVEGPLLSEREHRVRFFTYGPLRIETLGCTAQGSEGCDPDGALWVRTSNPVRPSELERYLVVRPSLARRPADATAVARNYHYLQLLERPEPGQVYQLAVRRGLRDVYGQRLRTRRSRTLAMGDYRPFVGWPLRGEVLLPPLGQLPINSRNVERFDAFTSALDPQRWLSYRAAVRSGRGRSGLVAELNAARHRLLGVVDNDSDHHEVPLPEGSATRGPVWVAYQRPGQDGLSDQVVQVTDLGISAKVSPAGSVVWVTRLSDASPVRGARVRLVGNAPALDISGSTDSDGLVRFGADRFSPHLRQWGENPDTLIWVDKDGDASVRPIDRFVPRWRLQVPLHLAHGAPEYGLLTTDRPMYRPGDTIQLKGIVRRQVQGGNAVLKERSLRVQLKDSRGAVVASEAVETNEFGTFATAFRIPASAPLGTFEVTTEGLQGQQARGRLRVAEYRPATFEVSTETTPNDHFLGEPIQLRVEGRYLFGAPLAGGEFEYSVTRQSAEYRVPGSEGLSTTDTEYRAGLGAQAVASERLHVGQGTLDAAGGAVLSFTPDWEPQTTPQSVRVETTVRDLSEQSVTSAVETWVHPARYYLGIAPPEQRLPAAPSTFRPKLVALSPQGAPVPGRKVTLELVKRSWTVARRANRNGSLRTESRALDQKVDQCKLTTGREPRSCALRLTSPGQHFVVARSKDAAGNPAQAAIQLYSVGRGAAGFADNDERRLDLVLDQGSYRVGDTARLLVKSPFARSEALLTLEGNGLLESRRVTLAGPASTLDIPVDARMRPNAYVGVHLVQPVEPAAGGVGATRDPGYRIGYAQLRVDAEAQRLALSVQSDQAAYEPGQTIKLKLSAHSSDGRPAEAELLVYAVDEAVLSLTGYTPPDPLGVFTAPRPLSVATLETRESLGYFGPLAIEGDKGRVGGGGGALGPARSRFATTALFKPHVTTDSQGQAEVTAKLPDNLTRFRVMVLGVTRDDQYGTAEMAVEVRQPLMVRPALPRILRAGDRFEAAVVVTAPGAQAGPVRVRASVAGARLDGPDEVTLHWDPRKPSRRVGFTVVAEQAGMARLEFSAEGAAGSDSVTMKRTVAPPVAAETSTLYGNTDSAEAQSLGDMSELRPDTGGLEVMLAPTALVGLDAPLLALRDYRYACTEQLASGLMVMGPLAQLARRYGLEAPPDGEARLERRIAQIAKRQDGGGGFRLWPGSPEPHPWVSAYALGVLATAQRGGAYVPRRVFERGTHYLRRLLSSEDHSASALAEKALAVYTLTELGQPDAQFLLQLVGRREDLPTFARALLLRAAARGTDPGLTHLLRQELEAQVELTGARGQVAQRGREDLQWQLFDSPDRTHALVLLALLESNPESEIAPSLARGLLARRRRGVWANTQASAYALTALDAYRAARETQAAAFTARLWLGQELGVQAEFGASPSPIRFERSMADLAGAGSKLIFEKLGTGTLFYEARLRYARKRLPQAPLERGLFVSKAMRPVTLESLPAALETVAEQGVERFKAGGLVLVDLLVTSPGERHFVALNDPLPAGLEAVDASLAIAGSSLEVTPPSDAAAAETSRFRRTWHRKELRDDRVLFFSDQLKPGLYHFRYLARASTPGRFVMPPTRAEEMYSPETFGRTAAAWVVVE